MLISLTWVMLGITLCHLDLVSCIGSLLGYKRIKNIRLFNLRMASIMRIYKIENPKYSYVEKLEIILENVLHVDDNAINAIIQVIFKVV